MKATRVFQLTALALVVVAAGAGRLVALSTSTTNAMREGASARARYRRQSAAAQALLESGECPRSACTQLLPGVAVTEGRRRRCRRRSTRRCVSEAHRRNNQYAWEGGFFLLALGGVHRRDCARAARRGAGARGAGQLPRARLAPVQDATRQPAALARDHGAARAVGRAARARSSSACWRIWRAWRRWSRRSSRACASSADGWICKSRAAGAARGGGARRRRSSRSARARSASRSASDIAAGLYVLTDPLALDVVVRNVLENALAAVQPVGGGSIALARPRRERRGRARGARQRRGLWPGRRRAAIREVHARCIRAAAAATTAPASGCSSCGA